MPPANGYHQSKINPGFWMHNWRPICFTLCVDDFGIKYVGKEHADNLIQTLKGHYEISMDWNGRRYIGLPCNETTGTASSTSQCPATVKKLDSASNTPNLTTHNTNHKTVLHAPMATNNNFVTVPTLRQRWASHKDFCTRSNWSFSLLCPCC